MSFVLSNMMLSRQSHCLPHCDSPCRGLLASNVRSSMSAKFGTLEVFSIALDECCDIKDVVQLTIFVHGATQEVVEEFLIFVPIKGTTTDQDILEALLPAILVPSKHRWSSSQGTCTAAHLWAAHMRHGRHTASSTKRNAPKQQTRRMASLLLLWSWRTLCLLVHLPPCL